MDWLEQNLDAYRIIAEILEDLRETLRLRLDHVHGPQWYQNSLPDGLLDRLVARKEEEKAIDWYESEYQQIMSYALFPDLLEILEYNAESFPQVKGLAPTAALLNARFMELEVMRAKLGRARPISETELSFLGTFHLRFRKAIEDHRIRLEEKEESAPAAATQTAPSQPAPEPPPAPKAAIPPPVEPVTPPDPEPAPQAMPDPAPPAPPAPAEVATATNDDEPTAEHSPAPEESTPPPADPPPPETADEVEAEEHPAESAKSATFEEALEAGDSQVILRELYKEVTGIAEGIWTKEIPPPARTWELVSVSPWYENNFSDLGLRPASDFYDVISKVDTKMREGISKEKLQDYLKEVNFAHVLLALRDMFQKNHI